MRTAGNIKGLIKSLHDTTSKEMDERVLKDVLKALGESKRTESAASRPNIWREIMHSRVTKLSAAAVIIIAVIVGVNHFGGSIDGASVAWAELVEKIEQSHDEYLKELLSATKEKDTEKVNFYAHLLEEFWQKLGWMARAELEPEFKIHMLDMVADQK
jgi:septin family protein